MINYYFSIQGSGLGCRLQGAGRGHSQRVRWYVATVFLSLSPLRSRDRPFAKYGITFVLSPVQPPSNPSPKIRLFIYLFITSSDHFFLERERDVISSVMSHGFVMSDSV